MTHKGLLTRNNSTTLGTPLNSINASFTHMPVRRILKKSGNSAKHLTSSPTLVSGGKAIIYS